MGSSFSNIKLEIPVAMTLSELEEILDAVMSERSCERIEAPAGRSIHVAWDRGGKWLTLYDEGIGADDRAELDSLASELSIRCGTCAVSNTVLDSGLLRMRLFQQDEAGAVLLHDPARRENPAGEDVRSRGDLDLSPWLPLQAAGSDQQLLADLWERDEAAEDKLAALARAFGWSTVSSVMGLPEWLESGQDHAPAVLRLHFQEITAG